MCGYILCIRNLGTLQNPPNDVTASCTCTPSGSSQQCTSLPALWLSFICAPCSASL
uniref:Uncharacterized protein n=1 Tax=Xenopus tropicalis TaxID=8364 RepID=A0A1B8Y905_XENTR